MAQGMGAFAQGLVSGFMVGRQLRKDREEREFKDALKAATQDVSVSEQFSVVDPEGNTQVFDKQEDALKAMDGKEGFRLDHTFMVGDKVFADAEQAQFAARQANSEAGKLARQAEVAMQYGQPQLAILYAQAHDKIIDTNSKQAYRELEAYEKEGNVDGALQMLSRQAGVDGGFQLVQDEQGRLILVNERNGKPHPALGPFKDTADFFSTLKHGAATNYNNYMSVYQHNQTHALGLRQQAEIERSNRAREGISAGNLAVNQARLGIQQTEHEWAIQDRNNPKPVVQPAYDVTGQVRPLVTTQTRNADGSWSTNMAADEPLPGVYGRPPQGESETDRYLRELREKNAGGATPRSAWTGPPVDGRGLVEMNNSRGVAPATPAAPAAPTATAPQGRFGDKIPDFIYGNSPGLRMMFPRSGGGN